MKLIIQILPILYSIISFGQAQKTTTMKVFFGDCRGKETYSWNGADTVYFYKLPEDTLIYKIIPRQYREWPIVIESVQTGDYRLTYKNNYGQIAGKQILLTEQPSNSVSLCPDKLLEYPQNTLSKLQDKDTISIGFYSQGCFHTEEKKVIITKESDEFIARLFNISGYYTKDGKKGKPTMQFRNTELKAVAMTNQNIQDFIRFENELNYTKEGGCTTTDLYIVKSKYLNIKKTDGSCRWDGFYYLKKSFFGEKE